MKRKIEDGKSTSIGDITKTILAIQSLGYEPRAFAGNDFVNQLQNQSDYSFIHQALFGLIALDAVKATDSANVKLTRNKLITKILESDRFEKGWGFESYLDFKLYLDIDTTAMAIYALAPHQNRPNVQETIKDAVKALQSLQMPDGGYGNSSSTIEVIQALTILGEDPQGKVFTLDSGNNPVTNLLSYQLDNGAFAFLPDDKNANAYSTEKVLMALASLQQFYADGKSTIYTDIQYAGETPPPLPEKPDENENIRGQRQQQQWYGTRES